MTDESNVVSVSGTGIFQGVCDFCGNQVQAPASAQILSAEEREQLQQDGAEDKPFCCDEYKQYVQVCSTISSHKQIHQLSGPANTRSRECGHLDMHLQLLLAFPLDHDKLIDVAPHAPFGSEEERQAAQERALQK